VVYEAIPAALTLTGRDYSFEHRSMRVELVTVPSHGTLTEAGHPNRTLLPGDFLFANLTWPSVQALTLEYTGADDFFNWPATDWDGAARGDGDDAFTFRALSLEGDGLASVVRTQRVRVTNVNSATALAVPIDYEAKQSLYAYSSFAGDDDGLDEFPTTLVVSGVNVSAPDGDVDVVKVRIACEHGKVTINPADVDSLDFTSSAYCEHPTQNPSCKNPFGNGYAETVFLGTPSAVTTALDGFSYVCATSHVTDTCVVQVFDGAGGSCMPAALLNARRSGAKTTDATGAASSYLSPAAIAGGATGTAGAQCYASVFNFTVAVGDFAVVAFALSQPSCAYPYCLPLPYFLAIVLVLFVALASCCMTLQQRYQAELRALVGLDL